MFVDPTTLWSLGAFVLFMAGAWYILSAISQRNTTRAEQRLERIGRPKSLAEIDLNSNRRNEERFTGLKETMSNLGSALEPQSDLEKNSLKIRLANAGFRSEAAPAIYQGIRMASLLGFLLPAVLVFGIQNGFGYKMLQWVLVCGGLGFYLPSVVLWYLRSKRQ